MFHILYLLCLSVISVHPLPFISSNPNPPHAGGSCSPARQSHRFCRTLCVCVCMVGLFFSFPVIHCKKAFRRGVSLRGGFWIVWRTKTKGFMTSYLVPAPGSHKLSLTSWLTTPRAKCDNITIHVWVFQSSPHPQGGAENTLWCSSYGGKVENKGKKTNLFLRRCTQNQTYIC